MERWVHIDLKCLAPTPESLKRDIAAYAAAGATGIVFEWENMFPFPGLAASVRPDAYSIGTVREILTHCRELGLTAIPLVQTLGHLEWLLHQPAFRPLREFDETEEQIRACDPRGTEIISGLIAALMETHADSPWIHLGADEAWRLKDVDRPECSVRREGASAVFLRHMRPFIDQVLRAGKRPIIWADMVLRHPESIDEFPRDVVMCDWMYSQRSDHAASVYGWDFPDLNSTKYASISDPRKALFEPYWRIDAPDFPQRFYQFPYTPFLRDRGFDVIGGPATIYAGFPLTGSRLPEARANQRGWWRAVRRFGGLGALNTCWVIRGALRESNRTGNRAFAFMASADPTPEDDEVSKRCWAAAAGADAAAVAAAVDALRPPVNEITRTAPLRYDAERRFLRPRSLHERLPKMRERLAAVRDEDGETADNRDAVSRARRLRESIAPHMAGNEEAEAWWLNAGEVELRARVWEFVRGRAHGESAPESAASLQREAETQAGRVAQFMNGRYLAADARALLEDRYEGLVRLIGEVGASVGAEAKRGKMP